MSEKPVVRRRRKVTKKPLAPESEARPDSVYTGEIQLDQAPVPYDENLLERASSQWQFGDWISLTKIERTVIQPHPDRAKLALLAAAGHFQLGDTLVARQFVRDAQDWGCSAKLVGQILVAGVHNSLGRAAVMTGQNSRALDHFKSAILIGAPGCDARLISRARIRQQFEQLGIATTPPVSFDGENGSKAQPRSISGTANRSVAIDITIVERPPAEATENVSNVDGAIQTIGLSELGIRLGSDLPPPAPSSVEFDEWEMRRDDGPILTYLFKVHQPKRHLEFGTWQGWGTCLCLESTAAAVWTINLPDGESKADGSWAYGERVFDSPTPQGAVAETFGDSESGPITYHRTDAGNYIGWLYREKNLGHRVNQILCDSREWDSKAYPEGFFDSAFIDGGHQADVVVSDTRKALSVVRSGGMVIWHDFCPLKKAGDNMSVVKEVTSTLEALMSEIGYMFSQLNWIDPSMILFGIKK